MELKEIIKTLMLSELYFNLPLAERKEVVWKLWNRYGQERSRSPADWQPPPTPSVPTDDTE